MKDIVFRIEDEFPDARNIIVNGIPMWPYIRIMFRYMMVDKMQKEKRAGTPAMTENAKKEKSRSHTGVILGNFFQLFRKHEVVIFSNELEKKAFEGEYIDKLSETIAGQLGKRALTINDIPPGSPVNRKLKNRHSINQYLINYIAARLASGKKISIAADHKKIIDAIIEKYGFEYSDLERRILDLLARISVLKLLFRIKRPKFVITSCYSYFPEIYAAKQLNISTVELQHGIVSPLHPGYESNARLERLFYADHLFLFGPNSIKSLSSNVVDVKNASVVGNNYLQELYTRPLNEQVLEVIKGYERSVCVPTDYLTESEIIPFITQAAVNLKNVVFLIVPRGVLSNAMTELIRDKENIVVLNGQSFQDVVRHCKYHTATNSTCCLEALSMGVPNILINSDNKVYEMYKDLVDRESTRFVSSVEEYIKAIDAPYSWNPEQVRKYNENNFALNYRENLKNAAGKIGLKF
jgi:hypothetical protein